jgi:signal transduction histidine kinase
MVRDKEIEKLADYVRGLANGEVVHDIRDNREGALSILKSDIYKLALRLSEQAAVLNEEKALLKDILFDISHQLKTPLTSLTVMAELLEREDLPHEKRLEFLGNLQTALRRMDWMVKSLLKLATVDAETMLGRERASALEIIEQAVGQVSALTVPKGQAIAVEVPAGLMISCDTNWTREALVNILKNAGEHTPENGSIRVMAGENPVCAWISVKDSGEGIAPEDLPHLFKRFYRGRRSSKESVGIGLAMSLAVMQKQDGDIEAKSEKNGGAEFIMKFYR